MTASKKYFVFIYPASGLVKELLNLAIFALSPGEKWPAHITVAGPFQRKPKSRSHPEFDATVFTFGVWNFFSIGLDTVYLKVGMPGMDKYWSKPDFIGNPVTHLSLYNGKDRDFSREIFWKLKSVRPAFSFPVKGIEIVRSSSQRMTTLREEVNPYCLPATAGLEIDEIANLSRERRLEIAASALQGCNAGTIPGTPIPGTPIPGTQY